MNAEPPDSRPRPLLTDVVGFARPGTLLLLDPEPPAAEAPPALDAAPPAAVDLSAIQLAVVGEALNLSQALLHQCAREIEASLFERVYDSLRAQLPDLVERVLREHLGASATSTSSVAADDGVPDTISDDPPP